MAVQNFYFFGSYNAFRPFIIQVNSGADSTFTIPTTGGGYNYKVSTSDGQNFTGVTGNLTITFPSANTHYDIEISGDFPRIFFNNGAERLKLIDIKQWGDIEWTSMERAFYGCSNMTCSALDSPNLENLTNGQQMFFNCSSFNPTNFNPTLGNLTNGPEMFRECWAFDKDISSWNISNATNLNSFKRHQNPPTSSLTYDILWDSPVTGSISATDIRGVFRYNKSNKIAMQCGNVTDIDQYSFQSSVLEKLILIDLSVSFTITFTPSVTGAAIDDLANSVADMTGQTSPTVTMRTAQYNSCNTSIWTNKNWTIAQV